MIDSAWFLARQNPDGGWPYVAGGSAVEPTAYTLLALSAAGEDASEAFRRGLQWLIALQRPDGGFPPFPNVSQSSWVTALALLLPGQAFSSIHREKAVRWVLSQAGRESSWVQRLRMALLGTRDELDVSSDGWPWISGAAAWVMPTALTVVALRKAGSRDARAAARIRSGQAFLLARRCADGGWNHGASKALGYEAGSYPELTGIALLGLAGMPSGRFESSIAVAERHLTQTRSVEAASWLQLGLLAHRRRPLDTAVRTAPRTTQEAAVSALSELALGGRNPLSV